MSSDTTAPASTSSSGTTITPGVYSTTNGNIYDVASATFRDELYGGFEILRNDMGELMDSFGEIESFQAIQKDTGIPIASMHGLYVKARCWDAPDDEGKDEEIYGIEESTAVEILGATQGTTPQDVQVKVVPNDTEPPKPESEDQELKDTIPKVANETPEPEGDKKEPNKGKPTKEKKIEKNINKFEKEKKLDSGDSGTTKSQKTTDKGRKPKGLFRSLSRGWSFRSKRGKS